MFSEKRNKLMKKLEDIKQQIKQTEKGIASKKIKRPEATKLIRDLNLKREELEHELLDLIVETEESFQQESWYGFKKGFMSAIKSLENIVEKSVDYDINRTKTVNNEINEKKSLFNSVYAKLTANPIIGWITTAVLIYCLLISVDCLSGGFKMVSGGEAGVKHLFDFATNPFSGLLVGILATALIQSSSTTTSIIVGLCAAGVPVATAIPMIMGANIGTSVTNTLVSLGHIGNKDEFRRAFAAATVHDFFNLLAVIIFLPLEIMFGLLNKMSAYVTGFLVNSSGFDIEKYNFIKVITKPLSSAFKDCFASISSSHHLNGALFLVFGLILIFFSILSLGKVLRLMLIGKAERLFNKAVGRNAFTGIATGTAITVLVQSSSTTTSLVIPLAGAGIMPLRQVYPFTLGANIGTCITALIAALAIQSGTQFGLQIAFVHLLFNTFAVIVIYGIPFLREIPLLFSQGLARIAVKKKTWAFAYVLFVFFILPVLFLAISKASGNSKHEQVICIECQRVISQQELEQIRK